MKIAHLPAGFFPTIGGAQISTHNIAEKQFQAQHDVTLISRATNHWKVFKRLQKDVSYELLPLLPRSYNLVKKFEKKLDLSFIIGSQLQYYQYLNHFDVWHCNLVGRLTIYALPYLKKMGVPVVGTCRGIDIQRYPEVGYGWRLTQPGWEDRLRKALEQFDLLTAISDSVKEEYLALGVPESKIWSIPNGVNYEYIQQHPADRQAIRREMGWADNEFVLITVGRNHPKKGYKYIPEIIKRLAEVRKDFRWVLIGKDTEEIGQMAEAAGVGHFLQTIPQIGMKRSSGDQSYQFPSGELVALYKAADIFAFPTLIETFGNVTMESMSAGLPVVVTDAPGCRDIVKHRMNGLVSKVGDVVGMADHLLEVMGDERERNRLILAGDAYASQNSWTRIAARYVEAYQFAAGLKAANH